MGKLTHSYTRRIPSTAESASATSEVVEYEVYHVINYEHVLSFTSLTAVQATWNDPGFREYHRRMQIFILLYIEAGSYINEDDDAWEFALLSVLRAYTS
jgi:histone acetyltransferase 1